MDSRVRQLPPDKEFGPISRIYLKSLGGVPTLVVEVPRRDDRATACHVPISTGATPCCTTVGRVHQFPAKSLHPLATLSMQQVCRLHHGYMIKFDLHEQLYRQCLLWQKGDTMLLMPRHHV